MCWIVKPQVPFLGGRKACFLHSLLITSAKYADENEAGAIGITIVVVGPLVPSTTIYSSESGRVHRGLDYFRRRGQLFIETFPPRI